MTRTQAHRGPGSLEAAAPEGDPRAIYEARAQTFDREAEEKRRRAATVGYLRLLLFGVMSMVVWWSWRAGFGGRWLGGLGLLVVLFGWLVRVHRRARRRQRRVEVMAEVNREGIARVDRDWEGIPPPPDLHVPAVHDYARDLDLHGHASLMHLVGTCGTAPGWSTLWGWFQHPASAPELRLRQEAVRELRPRLDLRDALAAEARLLDQNRGHHFAGFLTWAEGAPSGLGTAWWLRLAAWVLPVVNVVLLVLRVMERIPTAPLAWSLLITTAVIGPSIRRIHRFFAQAEAEEAGIREYGPILALLARASFESEWGTQALARLDSGPRDADEEIRTLRRLLDMAEVRRSPLFHGPLLLLLLWDLHVMRHLEAWRARAGAHVRDWLAVVGEAEALSALAGLAHQNPTWAEAEVSGERDRIEARQLAHPLIPPSVRVGNDVHVGPAGSFLLVTGSNMSGKSTLLRSIGLNVVLGQAGGPVCATALAMPPTRVVTSMRVDDSLAGGVSFFMAELQRLKHVVDVAESGEDGVCLYLLDEMLQGTNSAERRVAARSVIRRLVESGAFGAVTTHDLTLAETPDLERIAVPVHFTETVGGGEEGLTFDYRLRPGVAQSTNALKLLRLVGLGDEE